MASSHSIDEIARSIEADSLGYLSPEGLRAAVRERPGFGYCDACFTGNYPIRPTAGAGRRALRIVEV